MSDEPPDNDLLAAEYVLGALPPDQARALEALALHDPAVAGSIATWEDRLAPLADLLAPVDPPALLWRRLALAIGIEDDRTRTTAPARSAALNLWRATAAAGFAIAASLGFLLWRPAPPDTGLVAALSPAGAPAPAFLIKVAPGGKAVIFAQNGATPPAGRAFELWELKPGAAAPVSLGILPTNGQRLITMAAPAGTQLLVSQETPGGSPTGQPTGPVVFSGTLAGT